MFQKYDLDKNKNLRIRDEKLITYDAIGNPETYDGYTFTWEQGRHKQRTQILSRHPKFIIW